MGKINATAIATLLVSCAAICIGGCSKEKFDEDYCLKEDYKETISINLHIDAKLNDYKYLDLTDWESDSVSVTRAQTVWNDRYVVNVYTLDGATLIASTSTLDSRVDFELPVGKYKIVAWADRVPWNTNKSFYFHTDDFTDMLLIDKLGYTGNDTNKAAYLGTETFTVSYRNAPATVNLTSAMGQYRIVASDEPDYAVGKVVISYPKGVPASLNALTGKICHYWNGVSFNCMPQDDCLVYDNVLAQQQQIDFPVIITVYDEIGKLKARRIIDSVPVIKGGVTLIKTLVYTVLQSEDPNNPGSGGNLGIDDEYDEIIEILI